MELVVVHFSHVLADGLPPAGDCCDIDKNPGRVYDNSIKVFVIVLLVTLSPPSSYLAAFLCIKKNKTPSGSYLSLDYNFYITIFK